MTKAIKLLRESDNITWYVDILYEDTGEIETLITTAPNVKKAMENIGRRSMLAGGTVVSIAAI